MKKWMCLCFVLFLLMCVCAGCGQMSTLDETNELSKSTTTTTSEQKTPLEEMKEAQKNFTYGTYTTSLFENTWLNLRFTPYRDMYSNPEVDKEYERMRSGPEYEYQQRCMMDFYYKEGTTQKGFVSVAVQKLSAISTAKECLTQGVKEVESAIEQYPQLSFRYGEQGTIEFCGEQYEYQKYSISGGANSGTSIMMYRILDGYAVIVSIKEGHYTIDQQMACFEAIN